MKKNDIHILVVDDDVAVNESLKELIQRSGFKVSAVTTPQEASNVVRLKKFHLALVDCMLPVINGIDLAKQLLSTGLKGVPIILMSGVFRDEQFAEEALKKSGAIEFITKPFDSHALVAKINTLLSPLLDYKGGSLESLLTKIDLTKRESKKALDYIEDVVGFDLMLIFNVLMQSKLSGYLNVTDKNKKLYGFTMFQGNIVDVDTLKNVKDVAALISKMGLVSESEANNMVSVIDKRNPIGFLVQENLISQKIKKNIKIDKILDDYKKLVVSESININFIENRDLPESEIIIQKDNFDFLNYELCMNRVPFDFVESFFAKGMDYTVEASESYDVGKVVKNVNSSFEELVSKFQQKPTLNSLLQGRDAETTLKFAYYLVVNRLIYFSDAKKEQDIIDRQKRFTELLDKIQGKNPIEVFQYFGTSANPNATEVETIYKEFARSNHPDKLPKTASPELAALNNKVYSIVSEAYSVLTHTDKRTAFINELKEKEARQQIKGEEMMEKAVSLLEQSQYTDAHNLLLEAKALFESKDLWLNTIWARVKVEPEVMASEAPMLRAEL
ncbi:MAG: response regulator, partial [Bdellovibrionales bacterium]|nr:response regulator [Bdellovibrionales bacterium]